MVGWHYWLDWHEFVQVPRVDDGQGSLACCSSWGHKECGRTEQLNWTELSINIIIVYYRCHFFLLSFIWKKFLNYFLLQYYKLYVVNLVFKVIHLQIMKIFLYISFIYIEMLPFNFRTLNTFRFWSQIYIYIYKVEIHPHLFFSLWVISSIPCTKGLSVISLNCAQISYISESCICKLVHRGLICLIVDFHSGTTWSL